MASVNRFEDLEIWKGSKSLSIIVYSYFKNLKDFGFRDQICRASISVINYIAEGLERNSDKEFQRFLKISKGSAGEVGSMIWMAIGLAYIDVKEAQKLIERYTLLSSKISSLIQYLNQ